MFSVIFEVNRKSDHIDDYLEQAKQLKPILEKIDGFIDNERFESQLRKGWLLSHSTWRDEKSVVRWRTQAKHHTVQEKGRFEIFQDYHLRVGEVVSDTEPPEKTPIRELRFDETEVGAGKYASFTEVTPDDGAEFAAQIDLVPAHLGLDLGAAGLVDHDIFSSIVTKGKLGLLVGWKSEDLAKAWTPRSFDGVKALRHRVVRVIRDYGMFDRREAPQFYPDAEGAETRRPEPTH
jgi:heme-degrading monooxygenase HmoA